MFADLLCCRESVFTEYAWVISLGMVLFVWSYIAVVQAVGQR